MLTSSNSSIELNKHRRRRQQQQQQQLVDVVSVLSGSVQLLSRLQLGRCSHRRRRRLRPSASSSASCSSSILISTKGLLIVLVVITIIIISLNGGNLAHSQAPKAHQQQQQLKPPVASLGQASLPNNNNNNNYNNNNNNNQHLSHTDTTKTHKAPPQSPFSNPTHSNFYRQHQQQHHQPPVLLHRPHSSSSSTQIEDLNDSSIKTRLGVFNGSWPAAAPTAATDPSILIQPSQLPVLLSIKPIVDFEELIDRLLRPISAAAQKAAIFGQPAATVSFMATAADQQLKPASADPNNKTTMRFFRNNKTFASIVYTNEQLVPAAGGGGGVGTSAAGKPPVGKRKLINCHLVDMERHHADVQVFEAKYQIKTLDVEFREMMQLIDACTDIARMRSALARPPSSGSPLFAPALPKLAPGPPTSAILAQQQQQQQNGGVKLLVRAPARAPSAALAQYVKRHLPGGRSGSPELVSKAVNRVGETGKRLVLGEVTPVPGLVEARGGTIREALQEITSYDTTDLLAIWRGILPGTNWCGMGDRATSYNDLGFESDIDICCRAHDFCPIRLSAFSSGYGLFNWSFYTRSHCWCDQNFLDCLQRAQSPLSSVVMKFYFTIMKTTCLHDNETIAADQSPYSVAAAASASSQATRRPLTPLSVSWWSLNNKNNNNKQTSSNNNNNNNNNNKQTSPSSTQTQTQLQQQQPQSPEQEHKLLLEQIRAKMPIPALKQSQAFYAKLDGKPPSAAAAAVASISQQQQQLQEPPAASPALKAGYK